MYDLLDLLNPNKNAREQKTFAVIRCGEEVGLIDGHLDLFAAKPCIDFIYKRDVQQYDILLDTYTGTRYFVTVVDGDAYDLAKGVYNCHYYAFIEPARNPSLDEIKAIIITADKQYQEKLNELCQLLQDILDKKVKPRRSLFESFAFLFERLSMLAPLIYQMTSYFR